MTWPSDTDDPPWDGKIHRMARYRHYTYHHHYDTSMLLHNMSLVPSQDTEAQAHEELVHIHHHNLDGYQESL